MSRLVVVGLFHSSQSHPSQGGQRAKALGLRRGPLQPRSPGLLLLLLLLTIGAIVYWWRSEPELGGAPGERALERAKE